LPARVCDNPDDDKFLAFAVAGKVSGWNAIEC
jgi:hypothetical protein